MSVLAKSSNDRKKENNSGQNAEEVKIYGKVSRLYLQGELLYPAPVPEVTEPVAPKKKKNTRYVILPVKDKDSVVEFIKVPMFKIDKKLESKCVGEVDIQKLCLGREPLEEKQSVWCTNKSNFQLDKNKVKSKKKTTEPAVKDQQYEGEEYPESSKSGWSEAQNSRRTDAPRKPLTYQDSRERKSTSTRNSLDFTSRRESGGGGQYEEPEKTYKAKSKSLCPKKDKKKPVLKRKKIRKDDE